MGHMAQPRVPPGAKRRGERQPSPAGMERSGIPVRVHGIVGSLHLDFSASRI